VTDADLANLADLRLRAEAQYPFWRCYIRTAVASDAGKCIGSECGRAPSQQQKAAAAYIFALIRYRLTGALEQPNKSVDLVVVTGVQHSSSDNKSLLADRQYGHKVDSGQKLLQFAF
jgi:hypothetical protein